MNPVKTETVSSADMQERSNRMRIPIKVKLSIAFTFLVCVTILIVSTVMLNKQKDQLYMQTIQTGKVSLDFFVNDANVPLLNDDILQLNTLIKQASSVEGLLYAVIVDRDKMIKAHTDSTMIGKSFSLPGNTKDIVSDGTISFFQYSLPSKGSVLNLARSVVFHGKDLGEVNVGISLDFIEKQIRKEALFVLFMTIIVVFVGLLAAIVLGIGFSRPISKLVLATREIGKGNYEYNVNVPQNDELGDLAESFNSMAKELWTKSLMQSSFGKYVSPEVLKMILANPEDSWLKGTRSEATVLFTDIRGFTAYSETKEPEEIVEALNEYFAIATEYVLKHGGHVDKFIGDAVLGVFGVPVFHEDHSERAVRASFEMQLALKEASKERNNPLLANIGIGINSGVLVSGNLGSESKMEYTVIGDTVNVASRLNGLAKSGEVVVSKGIYEKLKDVITVEALPPQKIKGKTEPVETFRVVTIKESK